MNWELVREKYPKAWQKLRDWDFKRPAINHPRRLYDFFDEQGIYINISRYFQPLGSYIEWVAIIDTEDDFRVAYLNKRGGYPTRTEAEEKAFEKAFEILEGRIK
jgi:hypothetical protein